MLSKKEVNLYKIPEVSFFKVLPKLLESIVAKGNKIILLAANDEQISSLDDLLWVYSQLSFLPHATYKDELREGNPIYITTSEQDNIIKANFIAVVAENYIPSDLNNFEKYLFFYNEKTLNLTKDKLKKINEMGGVGNFITQDEKGQWIKSGSLL